MPATTTPRDLILDAIALRLGAIGDPGLPDPAAYFNSPPQVMRLRHSMYALPQMPCCLVVGLGEEYVITATTGVYARSLEVVIIYASESQTQDEDASKMSHDVELALADHRLGGVCDDLVFLSSRTHISDSDEPLFYIEFNLRAKYRTTLAAPGTRV